MLKHCCETPIFLSPTLNDPARSRHESLSSISESSEAFERLGVVCFHAPNKDAQALGIYEHYSMFWQKL